MLDKANRPRIAVFTKQLDSWKSGSGHHMAQVMTHVLDRNDGRFDFTFVHYSPSDNPIYSRVRELVIPRNPWAASRIIAKEGFDLVHYSPLTFFAPLWGVRSKKIATMHGAEQLILGAYSGPAEFLHETLLVPAYSRRMDGIFTVSETSARFFVERYGLDPERIVVAYNGLGPEYKRLRAEEVTAPERFGAKRPYVYHVSRFSERKNPWVLLEAFALFLRQKDRPHSLVCAGSGWDNPKVRRRAERMGIQDRLVFPGFLSERDSAELMNGAELFVYPSKAEGFGMPPTEAMASGCPVVCTAAFAMREVVGDAALVVDDWRDAEGIAAAMGKIVDEPELAAELRRRGEARRGLYSWDIAADKLLGLYGRLLNR